MLQHRIWLDQDAEIEFWKQMARVETVTTKLATAKGWRGLGIPGLFGRGKLMRELEALRTSSQELVSRHTVAANEAPATAFEPGTVPDALRTLAGLAVSLRQDRDGTVGSDRIVAP